VGRLEVPGGAVNVIPGRCEFSIDIRSGVTMRCATPPIGRHQRHIEHIAQRRGVTLQQRRSARGAERALRGRLCRMPGLAASSASPADPARRLPSGAGHDAMMMASLTDIGMLFVRCGNGGISHHPQETLSAADAEIAAQVFEDFLQHFELQKPSNEALPASTAATQNVHFSPTHCMRPVRGQIEYPARCADRRSTRRV
jgi:acetylornithine deacetylase/succinyl-diaminopimelate desuccinylase-like protein